MEMLQRQSDIATQEITFHCFNMKTNGFQFFTHDENSNYIDTSSTRYLGATRIEKDEGCDKGKWGKSSYKITTKRTRVLPVTDMLVYDVGDDEEFGVDVGEVCFRPEVRK